MSSCLISLDDQLGLTVCPREDGKPETIVAWANQLSEALRFNALQPTWSLQPTLAKVGEQYRVQFEGHDALEVHDFARVMFEKPLVLTFAFELTKTGTTWLCAARGTDGPDILGARVVDSEIVVRLASSLTVAVSFDPSQPVVVSVELDRAHVGLLVGSRGSATATGPDSAEPRGEHLWLGAPPVSAGATGCMQLRRVLVHQDMDRVQVAKLHRKITTELE